MFLTTLPCALPDLKPCSFPWQHMINKFNDLPRVGSKESRLYRIEHSGFITLLKFVSEKLWFESGRKLF
jgi:hypothetical protein